jgi:protein-S-isoprenylcysteine O-methyltransferase Ste14
VNAPEPDNANVRVLPGAAFMLCCAAAIAVEVFLPLPGLPLPRPFGIGSGLCLVVISLIVIFAGLKRFSALEINPLPIYPVAQLITGGVYRFTRNPMYLGLVVFLFGVTAAAGSPAFLAATLAMFVYFNAYAIPCEESYLTRTFGEDYRAYCARVRRWI